MEQRPEQETQFAIVTGSSSGLGFGMTEYLLENGFVVFGVSRSGTDLVHNNFIDVITDVRNELSVESLYSIVSETTERIHILVNNAGILDMSPIEETSSKSFQDVFATNLLGAFHILKHFRKFIIEGQTHIITTMSVASKRSYENMGAYCSSKAGLKALVDSCKNEWKKLGIRFTNLFPGAIRTPIWEHAEIDMDETEMHDTMISTEEFLYIFDMVVRSSDNLQFPDITFLHKNVLFK